MILLFLGYVAVMAAAVVGFTARWLGNRFAITFGAGMLAWFLYVGLMGYFGVIRNVNMRPPGTVLLLVPVLALIAFLAIRIFSAHGTRIVRSFPLPLLICAQVFRVGVELFLHELWHNGLVPQMLTYNGANVDIYIGATAPLIAWLSTRGKSGERIALIWNFLGLMALANVVTRAILTTPGPLNLLSSEVPDLMIGTFPYMFIPGFFVPLAVTLHLMSIRSITSSDSKEARPQAAL